MCVCVCCIGSMCVNTIFFFDLSNVATAFFSLLFFFPRFAFFFFFLVCIVVDSFFFVSCFFLLTLFSLFLYSLQHRLYGEKNKSSSNRYVRFYLTETSLENWRLRVRFYCLLFLFFFFRFTHSISEPLSSAKLLFITLCLFVCWRCLSLSCILTLSSSFFFFSCVFLLFLSPTSLSFVNVHFSFSFSFFFFA